MYEEQTETPPVGLRRSKRSKFHLDVVAIISGSQERRRHPADGNGGSKPRRFKSRARKKSPLAEAPLLSPELPLLERISESPDSEAQKNSAQTIGIENENKTHDSAAPPNAKKSPNLTPPSADQPKPDSKFPASQSSLTPKAESPENVAVRQPNPDLVCPTCNNEFKSRAGYVSHVRACERNGAKRKAQKSLSRSHLVDHAAWLRRSSDEDSSHGRTSRRTTNNRSMDSTGLLMVGKSEFDLTDELTADGDHQNESADADDLMPVLIPECTLESTRNSTPMGTRKREIVASTVQREFRSDDKRNKKPKLTSTTHGSLDLPFDVKSAANQRLQLAPVPQIIVDPPTAKKGQDVNCTCTECPYIAADSNLLTLHRILHRGDRPYRCQSCSYNCFSAEALHSHLDLHVPAMSPNSAVTMRKRIAANKRNGLMNTEFVPPNAPNVIQCNQCNFRTLQHDRFVQHRLEHIQTQRQRLVCIIKRSANDDSNQNRAKSRLPQPSVKFYDCKKCAFRVENRDQLVHHEELHGSGLLYACRHCDYASDAASVRDFHERHHHFEFSLTTYTKNLAVRILKKKASEVVRNLPQSDSATPDPPEDVQERVEDPVEESAASSSVGSDEVYKQFVPTECR